MLLQGNEIGLAPIRCKNKEGTESLKTLHYRVNDILYAHTYRYIFQEEAVTINSKLVALGKELKELKVPEKAQPKKNEILNALRTICRSLQGYSNYPQTSDDAEAIQRAVNGLVHQFIKTKNDSRRTPAGDSRLTPEEWLTFLVRTRKLYDYTNGHHHLLKLDTLRKVNAECLEAISSCGKI